MEHVKDYLDEMEEEKIRIYGKRMVGVENEWNHEGYRLTAAFGGLCC